MRPDCARPALRAAGGALPHQTLTVTARGGAVVPAFYSRGNGGGEGLVKDASSMSL